MNSYRRRTLWHFVPVVAFALMFTASGASMSLAASTANDSGAGKNPLGLVDPGYLTVGADVTYPPMEFVDTQHPGQYLGLDVDFANAMAKKMGLKGVKWSNIGFDALITSLEAHRLDVVISSMNDTPERQKVVDYVDYMKAEEGILVAADNKITADTYEGLCGLSVAAQKGTTETAGLDAANKACKAKNSKEITILRFDRDTDAFQAFASGHADAYTTDWPVVIHYHQTNPGKYRIAGKPILMAGLSVYGIAVRKDSPVLKQALKKALADLMADGEYAKLFKKWDMPNSGLKTP